MRTAAALLKQPMTCTPRLHHLAAEQHRGTARLAVPLTTLSDPGSVRDLRDVLVSPAVDRMQLALLLCHTCGAESEPVYGAWGLALLRAGRLAEARRRFERCFAPLAGALQGSDASAASAAPPMAAEAAAATVARRDALLTKVVHELQCRARQPPGVEALQQRLRALSTELLHNKAHPNGLLVCGAPRALPLALGSTIGSVSGGALLPKADVARSHSELQSGSAVAVAVAVV